MTRATGLSSRARLAERVAEGGEPGVFLRGVGEEEPLAVDAKHEGERSVCPIGDEPDPSGAPTEGALGIEVVKGDAGEQGREPGPAPRRERGRPPVATGRSARAEARERPEERDEVLSTRSPTSPSSDEQHPGDGEAQAPADPGARHDEAEEPEADPGTADRELSRGTTVNETESVRTGEAVVARRGRVVHCHSCADLFEDGEELGLRRSSARRGGCVASRGTPGDALVGEASEARARRARGPRRGRGV